MRKARKPPAKAYGVLANSQPKGLLKSKILGLIPTSLI